MKKILALLTLLCLVFLSAAALSETVISDGSTLVLDGFNLRIDKGAAYQKGSKAIEQVYVTVFPYVANGDTSTNFNCVWAGSTGIITVPQVRSEVPNLKQQMKDGFESYGYTLNSLDYSDPVDGTLAGASCVILDSKISLSVNGMTLDLHQRQFYVGGKGFIFTISANDPITLSAVTALLNLSLAWD